MAAPVLALLEKDLDDWGSAVLVKASKELGRGAGQNTVYLVVNQQSGVYIMNEALQECEMFDQIYGIGIIEGDILCAEKTAEHAAEGAPVSSSFTLQQRHVFRDKNEAGMQGDIIEDGEERLEVEMDFEDSLRTLRIADGWLAADDTKSGEALRFFQVASSLFGTYCNDDATVRFSLSSLGEFTLAQHRMAMQERSTRSTGLEDGLELQGVITSTMHLDAMHMEKSEKAVTAKFDLACSTVLLNVAGMPEPLQLHRIPEDRDPMQYVRDVFAHLNLQLTVYE